MDGLRNVEHKKVSVDELKPDEANVNEQGDDEFAALVQNIKEFGFLDPVVCWKKDGKLQIINGEHRWRAAKYLGYSDVPVAIVDIDEEDMARIFSIRFNYGRGKLNPFKFTKVVNELRRKYKPEVLRTMMGISNEKAWKQLYKDVRNQLPPAIRRELDKTKHEITDVDDLARVIKNAIAKYGHNLQNSFIFFEYSGRTHVTIKLNERGWANLQRVTAVCEEHNVDINDYVNILLENDDKAFVMLQEKYG